MSPKTTYVVSVSFNTQMPMNDRFPVGWNQEYLVTGHTAEPHHLVLWMESGGAVNIPYTSIASWYLPGTEEGARIKAAMQQDDEARVSN